MIKNGDRVKTNKLYKDTFQETHISKELQGVVTNICSYLGSIEIDYKFYIAPCFLEKIIT